MNRTVNLIVGVFFLFVMTGCAHHVPFNTPEKHSYGNKAPLNALFYMDASQKAVVWSGRSAAAGIANKWVVPAGQTVNMYAQAYLENGFASFAEVQSLDSKPRHDVLIQITDLNFYMANQVAHCTLKMNVMNNRGKTVFKKLYSGTGPSGGGRVAFGGAFGQKSAIRQSSHVALEMIFTNFMGDVMDNYRRW